MPSLPAWTPLLADATPTEVILVGAMIFAGTAAYLAWLIKRKL